MIIHPAPAISLLRLNRTRVALSYEY